MRLTEALWKKFPGHIFRGKHRRYKQVTPLMIAEDRRNLAIEEKNMFYLRNPYLTLEQDMGHAKALGKKEQWLLEKMRTSDQKLKPSVTIMDRLSHLRHSEAWD